MKLEGTLETFPLRELIDMVAYSSVTGALNIYTASMSGHLYFRDGQLYHVDYSNGTGLPALSDMLELHQAGFSFVSDLVSDEESLWGDLDYNMQTATRLALRWRQIRAYIPTLELVPLLLVGRDLAMRRVGPAYHPVLETINGVRSLAAIAAELSWAELDVAEAATQMSLDGLLDLRQGSQAVQDLPAPENQRGNLFERLRSRSAASGNPGDGQALRSAVPDLPHVPSEELVLRLLRS